MNDQDLSDSIKTIYISNEVMSKNTKKVVIEKPKKHRIITQTSKWIDISNNLVENEQNGLHIILDKDSKEQDNCEASKIISQHIRTKICSYASQDKEKKLYCEDKFVKYQDVLELFRTSELICYYCKEKTLTLYEYVREPKQWTLERLDNSRGHNSDNVVLACLQCNLRRRCMASERYIQTKEISKIVKLKGTKVPF